MGGASKNPFLMFNFRCSKRPLLRTKLLKQEKHVQNWDFFVCFLSVNYICFFNSKLYMLFYQQIKFDKQDGLVEAIFRNSAKELKMMDFQNCNDTKWNRWRHHGAE